MQFTFSIRKTLKDAWHIFKTHWKFFVLTSLIMVLINILGGDEDLWLLNIILMIASVIWSIMMMKVSLSVADGHLDHLTLKALKTFLPNMKEFFGIVGVTILSGLIVLGGFILLIIPGIYFAFRLSLSSLVYLDRKEGIRKSLRYSWDVTQGSVIWTVILVAIVSAFLYIIGFVFFGIGILITYPLAIILMAKFYRALSLHHGGLVAPQPVEIPAHTEPTPEPHHESETPAQ